MLLNVPPNGLLIKQIKRPDTRLKKTSLPEEYDYKHS